MKYIKHSFVDSLRSTNVLPTYYKILSTDYCINCNKSVIDLCVVFNIDLLAQSIEFIIEHTKCITEDEYIIKSIIE